MSAVDFVPLISVIGGEIELANCVGVQGLQVGQVNWFAVQGLVEVRSGIKRLSEALLH